MSFANGPAAGPASVSSRSRCCVVLVLVFPALFLLTGCMTLAGPDHQIVLIETEPPGAEVVTAEGQRCTTPCELNLPKMKTQEVWIEKAGFRPLEAALRGERWRSGIAASLAGNLALGATVVMGGAALLYYGRLEEGIGTAAIGVGIAFGRGALTDADNGVLLKLAPNPLRVILVPEVPTTEPSEDDPSPGAAPDR
jgi:hypothetical protein